MPHNSTYSKPAFYKDVQARGAVSQNKEHRIYAMSIPILP